MDELKDLFAICNKAIEQKTFTKNSIDAYIELLQNEWVYDKNRCWIKSASAAQKILSQINYCGYKSFFCLK